MMNHIFCRDGIDLTSELKSQQYIIRTRELAGVHNQYRLSVIC